MPQICGGNPDVAATLSESEHPPVTERSACQW